MNSGAKLVLNSFGDAGASVADLEVAALPVADVTAAVVLVVDEVIEEDSNKLFRLLRVTADA